MANEQVITAYAPGTDTPIRIHAVEGGERLTIHMTWDQAEQHYADLGELLALRQPDVYPPMGQKAPQKDSYTGGEI